MEALTTTTPNPITLLRKQMRQKEIAEACHVNRRYLRKVERGDISSKSLTDKAVALLRKFGG